MGENSKTILLSALTRHGYGDAATVCAVLDRLTIAECRALAYAAYRCAEKLGADAFVFIDDDDDE